MKTNGYYVFALALLWVYAIMPSIAQVPRKTIPTGPSPAISTDTYKSPEDLISNHAKFGQRYRHAIGFNSENTVYKPDSIIFYSDINPGSREIYSYDPGGNLLTFQKDNYDGAGWVHSELNSFTYDDQCNLLTELKMNWIGLYWEKNYFLSYTYDSCGNMLTSLIQKWENGKWVNCNFYRFSYDENGHILTYLEQYWQTEAWVNSFRYANTYDNRGNLLLSFRENWQGENWVNSCLTSNTYESEGELSTSLLELWNGVAWANCESHSYTYDVNSHLLTHLMQLYQNEWINFQLSTYTYDEDGNILTYGEQFWDMAGVWLNALLITRTYDENGYKLTELYQDWLDTWNNISNSTFAYDENGNCLSNISYIWANNNWENYIRVEYQYMDGLIRGIGYNWDGSGWINGSAWMDIQVNTGDELNFFLSWWGFQAEVYYSPLYTSIREQVGPAASQISVYPNPAQGSLNITFDLPGPAQTSVNIYDLSGKMVETLYDGTMTAGSQRIGYNTKNLAPGLYIIGMRSNDQYICTKVSISK